LLCLIERTKVGKTKEISKGGVDFGIYQLEFLKKGMNLVKEDSDTVTAAIDTMKEDGEAVNAVAAIR
jgi:hypothetical protein